MKKTDWTRKKTANRLQSSTAGLVTSRMSLLLTTTKGQVYISCVHGYDFYIEIITRVRCTYLCARACVCTRYTFTGRAVILLFVRARRLGTTFSWKGRAMRRRRAKCFVQKPARRCSVRACVRACAEAYHAPRVDTAAAAVDCDCDCDDDYNDDDDNPLPRSSW